jgi:hypothetical protein
MRDAKTKAIIRPRLLRYWVCLQLQAAREPMRIRELVANFELSPYEIRGRTSKAISDTIRWAVPRGWIHPMGRGKVQPVRIPDSTQRYTRSKLEAALAGGDPSWINTQERKLQIALAVARSDPLAFGAGLFRCRYDAAPGGHAHSSRPPGWKPLSL